VINWVVFDLGDVVVLRTNALPQLADLLGAQPGSFADAYWAYRREYDLSNDAAAFFTAVAARAGALVPAEGLRTEPQLAESLLAELVRQDDLGWNVVDAHTMQLINDLQAAGIRLALLSNAPSSMGRLVEQDRWTKDFEHLLFSGDLGISKPGAQIYRTLLDTLGADPPEVAFLDDRLDNITGARQAGIAGCLFTDAAQARLDLRGLGLAL